MSEQKSLKSLVSICRSLLIIRGEDPKNDLDVLDSFQKQFIETGRVDRKNSELIDQGKVAVSKDSGDSIIAPELLKGLITRIKELFESLDSNLEFQIDKIEQQDGPGVPESNTTIHLDLRAGSC